MEEEEEELSENSDNTLKEIEREIDSKSLNPLVEEVCSREKYQFGIEKMIKRYCTCYDDERDEIIKKLRRNGLRKLTNEMDLSRILRKLRDYETMFTYLLNDR